MGFAATDQDEYSKHDGTGVESGTCCWTSALTDGMSLRLLQRPLLLDRPL